MTLDVTVPIREQAPTILGDCSLHLDRIEALRDFFSASDGHDMEQSFTQLSRIYNVEISSDIDWLEIEFQFNRLFVGPDQIAAPPYASVYLEKSPVLMGSSTLGVRKIYASLGLEVPCKGSIPDDFIAFELDAICAIMTREKLDLTTLKQLISGHMTKWIPCFCERCRYEQSLFQPLEKIFIWLEFMINSLHMEISQKTNETKTTNGNQR